MNEEADLEAYDPTILERLVSGLEPNNFPQCTNIEDRSAHHILSSRCPKGIFPQATVRWSQGGNLKYRLERHEIRRVRSRGDGAVIGSTSWDLSHGNDASGEISINYKGRVPVSGIENTVVELLDAVPRPPGDMFHKFEIRNRSNNYVAFEMRLVEEGGEIDILRGAIRHRSKRFYYAFGASDASAFDLRAAREDPR